LRPSTVCRRVYPRPENPYLRTPADYVGALGGHIEVNAVFDDDVVPLGLVEPLGTVLVRVDLGSHVGTLAVV